MQDVMIDPRESLSKDLLAALEVASNCNNDLTLRVREFLKPANEPTDALEPKEGKKIPAATRKRAITDKENTAPKGTVGGKVARSQVIPHLRPEEHARRLVPFCMKLLNTAIKTLPKAGNLEDSIVPKEPAKLKRSFTIAHERSRPALRKTRSLLSNGNATSFKSQSSSTLPQNESESEKETAIACLAECSEAALLVLEKSASVSNSEEYTLDRAACHVASRLTELKQYERALTFLRFVHRRLSASEDSPPQKIPTRTRKPKEPVNPRRPMVKERLTSRQRAPSQSVATREIPLPSVELLSLPASSLEWTVARLSTSMYYLSITLRCLLELSGDAVSADLLLQTYGIHWTCQRLQELDPEAARKQSDSLFRLLYMVSRSKVEPTRALELRRVALHFFLQSSDYSPNKLSDYIHKFALAFEHVSRTLCIEQQVRSLVVFYQSCTELTEQSLVMSEGQNSSVPKWLDHCVHIAKQCAARDLLSHVEKLRASLSSQSFESHPDPPNSRFTELNELLTVIHSEVDKCSLTSTSDEPGKKLLLEPQLREALEKLQDLEMQSVEMTTVIRQLEAIFRAVKQTAVKPLTGSIANMEPGAFPRISAIWTPVLQILILVFHTLTPHVQQESGILKSAIYQQLSLNSIDILGALSNFFLESDSQSSVSYLSEAQNISKLLASSEGYRHAANSCFASASAAYNEKLWTVALGATKVYCDCLSLILQHGSGLQNNDTSSMSTIQIQLKIVKGFELCAACSLMLDDKEGYIEFTSKSLSHVTLPDVIMDEDAFNLSTRIVEKYVRTTFKSTAYVTISNLVLRKDSHRTKQFLDLIDHELRTLQICDEVSGRMDRQLQVLSDLSHAYTAKDNPVRRSRMLIEICRLRCASNALASKDTMFMIREAVELLKAACVSREFGQDEDLEFQCENDLALANSFLGILLNREGEYSAKPFTIALQVWKRLLQRVPPFTAGTKAGPKKPKAMSFFADGVAAFYQLRVLAKYFDMLNQPLNRIICLRLLLQMTTLLGDPDLHLMGSALYADIGLAYIRLGYTGQAGIALAHGRALIEAGKSNSDVTAFWQLCYVHYLTCIGNQAKSSAIFAEVAPSSKESLKDQKDLKKKLLMKELQSLINPLAFFVHSQLALSKGLLSSAILETTQALKAIQRHCERLKDKPSETVSQSSGSLEKVATSGSTRTLGVHDVHVDLVTQGKLPHTQLAFACYAALGHLYLRRGSIMESEHFLNEGLDLARKTYSPGHASMFLLALAELDYRRALLNDAGQEISSALEYQSQITPDITIRDVVISKIRTGDQTMRSDLLGEALKSLNDAEELLGEAMSEKVVERLEEKDVQYLDTPREKKLAIFSPLKAKPVPSQSRGAREKASIQTECVVLSSLRLEVAARTAFTFCQKGDITAADKSLTAADELLDHTTDHAEYYVTLAKVELKKLMKVMGSSPKYSMFFDAAFSLPWGVPDQTRLGKASKAEKALQTLREHIFKVLEIFKEAFTLAATSGTPQVLHELAHGMCFLNVLRAYIAPGAASDIPNLVLESAFYLEMAKGVTPRREMLAKLVKQEQKLLPKATWPTVNEDFQERTPSGQLLKLYQDEISSTPMDFREQILDRLPDSWVVVSLSVDLERQDLYLVRYEARCEPVLVRLPLSRQAMREGEESGVVYKIVIDELHDILRESNSMTKSGQACSTKEEIAEWWKSRRELDSRMQLLTESIENSWLGAFKGLLSTDDFDIPELSEATQQFKKTLERIVYKGVAQKGNSRRKKPALLEIEANLCRMLLRLGATPSDEDVEDALYYLMDAYQYSGINIDYDEMDIDAMEIEIKDAIEQFHQQHALHSQNSQVKPEQKHLILIPDKHLHMLPWEALPTLFDKPTSRLPCLSFLRDILRETNDVGHSIDPSNAHYILNPTNDLDATQKQFSPFVTSQEGWTGTIGEVPTEKQWLEGLEDRELFVYFGHGGGEQYARGYCIREMAKCAVTLLLGCSSGCLRSAGEFDPSGTPLHYMFAGSRAIVATLWDVTDRDLDRFSMSLFEKWGLIESGETSSCKVSLSAAVARSRGSCTLKYLTGAAPVVYGVPIFFNEKAQ